MLHTHTTHYTTTTAWLHTHAQGLIFYAKHNPAFAKRLYTKLTNAKLNTAAATLPTQTYSWATPSAESQAITRMDWLLDELSIRSDTETATARGALLDWHTRTDPQTLVFGVAAGVIIGPTLGVINRKKKQRTELSLIMPQADYQKLTALQLLSLGQQASLQLLGNELRKVGGQLYRLEPELVSWCCEEQYTVVATVPTKGALKTAETLVREQHIVHHTVAAHETPTAIAISPAAHDGILGELNATRVAAKT